MPFAVKKGVRMKHETLKARHTQMKLSATLFLLALMTLVQVNILSAQTAWPSEYEWIGYTFSNSEAIQDPQDIPNNQIEFDLVYESSPYVAPYTVQIAANTTSVFFRLQVRNLTTWTVGTYILFIADENGTILGMTYLTLSGVAGQIHVVDATGSTDIMTGNGSHTSNIGGWARFSSITNSTHEYVDFQIPRSTFESVLGINGQSSIKIYAGTNTGAGNINNINTDWMTPITSGVPASADFSTLSSNTLDGFSGNPLPVELTSFSAYLKSNIIELRWNTATEKNNFGFEIERSLDGKNWSKIAFVEGYGNSNSPKNYASNDAVDGMNGTISYRLKQIDRDGTTEYSSIVMVTIADANAVSITDAYPNPFNPTTTINFTLTESANVRLSLFDVTGREVSTVLDNASLSAGVHAQTINADGLPSGRYMVVLQTPAARSVYSVLLSK